MEKRDKIYKLLGMIIGAEFVIVYILSILGYRVKSWIGNALGTTAFIVPIVILLFYAGTDERLRERIQSLAKAGGWFLCICWVLGAIATLASL